MDIIKQAILGHPKKNDAATESATAVDSNRGPTTTGATEEGSHLAGSHQSPKSAGTRSEDHPPTHIKFADNASPSASRESTGTTKQPPHFSNTTDITHTTSDSLAEQSLERDRTLGEGLPDRTARGQQEDYSRPGTDVALGTGVASADGNTTHEPNSQYQDEASRGIMADTDRSFPLAGGVATSSALGSQDKEVSAHDTYNGNAQSATAAATGASPSYQSGLETEIGSMPTRAEGDHNRDALGAATTAATTSTALPFDLEHNHGSHGHNFSGDPCGVDHKKSTQSQHTSGLLFTSGPHATDTANRLDPQLHIPGEFPNPTPVEERTKPMGATAAGSETHHELRHTGSLEQPANRTLNETEQPVSQHHYGHDAAMAGGAGVAGLGAYAAERQHERGPTNQPPMSQQETVQPIPQTRDEKSHHHYGRDVGLAGAGAATAGGLYYANQRDGKPDSGPASSTIGPHQSNIANVLDPRVQPDPALQKHHTSGPTSEDPATSTVGPHRSNIANIIDPRVQPEPEKQKEHTTTGPHQSDTLNRLDPNVDSKPQSHHQHHYGRDAAIVGGTGSAGYGMYETAKGYDEHRSTQPTASMNEQRYDPTAPGAHVPTQATTHHTHVSDENAHHHTGRNVAMGAGLGAVGGEALAHTGSMHDKSTPQPLGLEQRHEPTSRAFQYDPSPTAQHSSAPGTQHPVAYSSQQYPTSQGVQPVGQQNERHYGRDAAVGGGLAAAGAGVYATSHKDGNVLQSQQPQQPQQFHSAAHQHYDSGQNPSHQHHNRDAPALGVAGLAGAGGAYAYSQHDAEKERLAQEKARERELEHQRKEIDKQHSKDAKHHSKLLAAEDKAHQKELEHEREKELKRQQKAVELRHEKEETNEKKHHLLGFLHHDKKAKEEKSVEGGPGQFKDSPRHSKEYAAGGAAAGIAGGAAAYEATHGHETHMAGENYSRNRLHKDPPPGHPAHEAMIHQQPVQHMGTDGPIGDPNPHGGLRSGVYSVQGADNQKVIEPHTGLPINVGKYGDGHGGTDASRTVPGFHQAAPGQTGEQDMTQWDTIKKANTPY